jgi:S1-C subfamily serine protease
MIGVRGGSAPGKITRLTAVSLVLVVFGCARSDPEYPPLSYFPSVQSQQESFATLAKDQADRLAGCLRQSTCFVLVSDGAFLVEGSIQSHRRHLHVFVGSATAVADDGYLLTAAHVVRHESRPFIGVASAGTLRWYPARIVWSSRRDEDVDLALVHVDTSLRSMPIAGCIDSDGFVAGAGARAEDALEWRFLIDCYAGCVSSGQSAIGSTPFSTLVCTAPGRPGNSGGPLVNRAGQLLGIFTTYQRVDRITTTSTPQPLDEVEKSRTEYAVGVRIDATWLMERIAADRQAVRGRRATRNVLR